MQVQRLRGNRRAGDAAAGIFVIAASPAGIEVRLVNVVLVERSPTAQGRQKNLLILLGDGFVERVLARRLGEEFRDID